MTSFKFGANDPQTNLFGEAASESFGPVVPPQVEGSTPITPLQISVKSLHIERISINMADQYSIKYHYLHRTAKNSKLALGIFAESPTAGRDMYGIMIWGLPVAALKGQYGKTYTQLELRRMFCSDLLPRNSESRCLAMAGNLLRKLFPQVRMLIAYSDLSQGHKGGIYKAAGWQFAGKICADEDGGWSKHPRHNRVEFGDKYKWVKWLPEKRPQK